MMRQQLSAVRWKRLSLASVAGVVLLMAAMAHTTNGERETAGVSGFTQTVLRR
jgi:hypothetical protein